MNITAPVAAVLWFQFWQYYPSTDSNCRWKDNIAGMACLCFQLTSAKLYF
ncbi:hypothetical protein FDUTEX481_04217 [Tolypothrix sp. PCC 7601]|nr:hypothetical protein FDUTEX481_04217 [Tolypothrix sp. PCC 7601]